MEEELKEVWTTQIRPGKDYGYTDKSKKALRNVTEVYNDLSEYKPKYISAGVMGWNSKTRTYPQLKPIKVRRQDGGFDFYMVPQFAAKGIYVDKPKQVVEPITDLASQNNQQAVIQPQPVSNPIPTKSNAVANQTPPKSVTQKSNTIVKQPVPQNLLPYIANVTSDGVVFFNIPDGYTQNQFEEAIQDVYGLNKDLSKKPMVYYEKPKQQIQQQKQQQQAVQQSQKWYQLQRQYIQQLQDIWQSYKQKQKATKKQDVKYNTDNNAQIDERYDKKPGEQDLVADVFAYPSRDIHVYSIHPEAYQKTLEYLNKNYYKTKIDNKPDKYVLSIYGFDKVPIGGEVNDSIFHYIGKDGKQTGKQRYHYDNANIINKNEFVQLNDISNDNKIVTQNGKLKLYSNQNNDDVYYKNNEGSLIQHPFDWYTYEKVGGNETVDSSRVFSHLKNYELTQQQAIDFINESDNRLTNRQDHNVIKYIFYPIEKQQSTQNNLEQQVKSVNNSGQQTKNTNNLVQKAKQAGKKVLSFLGFQNGGQLKYYKNGK